MKYEEGDYVKVEFLDEDTGENEWMWVRVDGVDDDEKVLFGTLDNQPVVHKDMKMGMQLAIRYDKIREHMKAASFHQ